MIFKHVKRILALAATVLVAFGAEAAANNFWQGGESGVWSTVANWSRGKTCNYSEHNRFTNNVTVTVDASFDLRSVYLTQNVDVTLIGDTSTAHRLKYYAGGLMGASGSALRLKDVILQERGGSSYPNAEISVPTFEVVAGGTVWFNVTDDYASKNVQISSPISGSGTIDIQNSSYAGTILRFQGDNSAFAGTFNMSGSDNAQKIVFESLDSGSANATWNLECTKNGGITVSATASGALKFGALTGSGVISNVSESAEVSLELGGKNTDFACGLNVCGMSVRKVGTGTMTWSGSNVSNLTVAGGSVAFAAGTVLDKLTLDGGTIAADLSSVTTRNIPVTVLTVTDPGSVDLSTVPLTGVPDGCSVIARDVIDLTKLVVTIAANDAYVWTGTGSDTKWSTLDNWKFADESAVSAYPTEAKTVIFPQTLANAEVTLDVFEDTDSKNKNFILYRGTMVFNRDTKLVGTSDRVHLRPVTVQGSGVIILKDACFETASSSVCTFNNDLTVLPTDGEDPWASSSALYIRGANGKFVLNGKLTGTGRLSCGGDSNSGKSYTFTGDMSGFSGKLEIANASKTSFGFGGTDAAINLSGATVNIGSDMTVSLKGTYSGNAMKVGALQGGGTISNATSNAMTLEVGALNADAESAVLLTPSTGASAWTVKKVGTGTQTLTDATVAYNADLRAGYLGAPVGKAFGSVALNDGQFKFAVPYEAPWTNGTAQTLFTCTSGVDAGRTVDYVTLDISAFEISYDAAYDNTQANILKVVLTPTVAPSVWNGPVNGLWSEASNWLINDEPAQVPPGVGSTAQIGANAVILVDPGQVFGTVSADSTAKLGVLFTDSELSFTAPADFAGTVEAAGPYSVSGSAGVYTAVRVPSTFTWVGGDGDWADVANWKVGTYPTAVVPGHDDTAFFPALLVAVSVAITTSAQAGSIVANADLTLSGATRYLSTNLIRGDGLLTLNGAKLLCYDANMDISNDVCVATGTDNELRTSVNKSSTFYRINLLGNLSGNGSITAHHGNRQNAGVAFYGDNHAFGGTFETTYYNHRDATYMDSYVSSSSNAVWKVNAEAKNSTTHLFPSDDDTYKFFGAYIGNTWVPNGTKLEIGHRDDVESTLYAYSHINWDGYTVRKVGSGVLNLKYGTAADHDYAVTKVDALYLEDGLVRIDYDLLPKVITFEAGGTLAYEGDARDFSANIVNSTAAIAIDDEGMNATWETALAASNTGGFTKKGEGTLTLTEIPEYAGVTKVEAGVLAMPSGSQVALDVLSDGSITGAQVTNVVFATAETTTNVSTRATSVREFAAPVDYSNVTIDLRDKTYWVSGATYYVVTSAGIAAGTSIVKPSRDKLLLPDDQQGKWMLRTVDLPGTSGKMVLAVVQLRHGMMFLFR